jgi:peroxiredoxin
MSPLKIILACTLLFFILFFKTNAQVTLSGNAPSYKGEELVFFQFSDLISRTEIPIGRCIVMPDGNFSVDLKIDETEFIFSHLGIYKIYLFAEPGKKYQIVLPENEPKTESQRLNPFFREVEVHVGITNIEKDDLNVLISSFDTAFNEHFDQIVMDAYAGIQSIPLDSLINQLESIFSKFDQPFFTAYRQYRYGLISQLSLMQKSRSISDNFFLNKPILYNNPSYMELFNLLYDKYFLFFARSESGQAVFSNISDEKSYTKLKTTLAEDDVLANDSLLELVILKGLHDGFFDDKFSRSALLTILDSLYKQTKIAEHLVIAENIRSKVTRLLPGFVPSPFELYSSKGKLMSLNDFEGKYVYLNFCSTSSYTCLQEFSLLEKLYEKHGKFLEIVTISIDKDAHELKDFVEQTKYPWTFLHYGNKPDIIRDFDVRAYPTYFLIGPDRTLIMSPAASPKENFEILLFKLLRSKGEI